jgi:hypothetical protein
MIQFLKADEEVEAEHSFVHFIHESDEMVRLLLICDGCGERCLGTVPRPTTLLGLMLQIDENAWDSLDSGKRLSSEYCVMVKREYNKYPDYKILCPDCEVDPACPFREGVGEDPKYVRVRDDALNFSELEWENWVVPSTTT